MESISTKEYSAFTYLVDKATINFIIGFVIAVCLGIVIVETIIGNNCLQIFLILTVIFGFMYAFGGIGIVCGIHNPSVYKPKVFQCILCSIISSASYLFPLLFLEIVMNFIGFMIPRFKLTINAYSPKRIGFSNLLGPHTDTGDIDFFNSNLGIVAGGIAELLVIFIALLILFSFINSVTALIKIKSK